MAAVQNRVGVFSSARSVQPGWGVGIVLFNALVVGVFWWQLPPQIPLFYSLPYGTNRLADKQWLFILPALALFIWIGYWIMARLTTQSPLYGHILKWLHLLCLLLITVAIAHILLIVL